MRRLTALRSHLGCWVSVAASRSQERGTRARPSRSIGSPSPSSIVRGVCAFHAGPGAREPSMEYHDKVLKCAECGAEFVFTAGEQMFFADKGFKNEPAPGLRHLPPASPCNSCSASARAE